jgi:hypothetical protein
VNVERKRKEEEKNEEENENGDGRRSGRGRESKKEKDQTLKTNKTNKENREVEITGTGEAGGRGLRYLAYIEGRCSHCFAEIGGEGIEELYQVKGLTFTRRYHVKCFIKEYQPLFDRLSGSKLLTPAQEA